MAPLNYGTPPVTALRTGERASGGINDTSAVERELKSHLNEWALVYGDDEEGGFEPATKSVALRWDKKPGFETARELIEESKVDDAGKKIAPSAWRYKIWIRYTGVITDVQRKAARKEAQEIPIPGAPVPPDVSMPSSDLTPIEQNPNYLTEQEFEDVVEFNQPPAAQLPATQPRVAAPEVPNAPSFA